MGFLSKVGGGLLGAATGFATGGSAGAAAGGLSGLLGGVGTKKGAATTSTGVWQPAQKYYLGDANTKGLLPEAEANYRAGAWSPEMQALANQQGTDLSARVGQYGAVSGLGSNLLGGNYGVTPERIQQVDMNAARASQGVLDPTQALARSMSGQVDNPQLDVMQRAATRGAERAYQDTVDNALTQVLPSIRGNAIAAGGYGGSRQKIAEGLIGRGLMRGASDIGIASMDAGANLRGNAYESAQNRMATTAGNLNQQAQQVAFGNADIVNQNNQNALAAARQNAGLQMSGVDVINAGNALQDNTYAARQGLLGAPAQYNWANLGNYRQNTAGALNGTGTTSTPYSQNNTMQTIGNALNLGQMFSGNLTGSQGMLNRLWQGGGNFQGPIKG